MSQAQTLSITEVADRLGISVSTVKVHVKKRLIPQPLKRKSDHEHLRWRTSDIDKHLKTPAAANDPIFSSFDSLLDQRINERIKPLEQKIVELEALLFQQTNH